MGKFIITEFDKLKDGFLENLSVSINKKIQVGNISGDYLYNLNIKDISMMNRKDNTVYVNIPSVDIEYNILRIILDSSNGLNYIKSVKISNFDIFLRDGLFELPNQGSVQVKEKKQSRNLLTSFEKIRNLKVKLVNGRVSRTLWGGRRLVIEKINGTFEKKNSNNLIRLSGKLIFHDKTNVLKANFSVYAYKTDGDNFTAGVIHLRNVRYGVFYLKEAIIGLSFNKNKIKFTTLNRPASNILVEKVYHGVFEPGKKYDTMPSFSGEYNFKTNTFKANAKLHSAPYTVNKVYNYFVRPKIGGLFKYGFYPYGSAQINADFKAGKINYQASISLPNVFMLKDRLHTHISGNTKTLNINSIRYQNPNGLITGNGVYRFGDIIPELKLFCEDYYLPIGSGLQFSTSIMTKKTGKKSFDLVLEDIDTTDYHKEKLVFSFAFTENAILVTSDTLINEKLKLNVTIPTAGGLVTVKLDFLSIHLDDVQKAVNPKYLAIEVKDTEDKDRYIIKGNITAKLGGVKKYVVDADINVLNEENHDKYLVKTKINFQNKIINFKKILGLNGDLSLKGKIKFDGRYIFPEFKGNFKFWQIDLAMRIITGPALKIQGLLNHQLSFRGEIKNNKIKFFCDLDDFVFLIARKPIKLSESMVFIYDLTKSRLTAFGNILWHNIDIFEGKKTGIWLRFSLINNVLTAHEVVMMSDFSSKENLNLEAGTPGYGKVMIDPVYSRVIVQTSDVNNSFKIFFAIGLSSNIIQTRVSFLKPFDFTTVDPDFYQKFLPGIKRGKVYDGVITALGPDYDVNLKGSFKVRGGLWESTPFNGQINFNLDNDVLVLNKIHIFNEKLDIKLKKLILVMDDTWQFDFNGTFKLNFFDNNFRGKIDFKSENVNNNNKVFLNLTNLIVNENKINDIKLELKADNMRFHDIYRDNWLIKVYSLQNHDFIGKIFRKKDYYRIDMAYFIDKQHLTTLEGTIKGKELNLQFHSNKVKLNFLNYLNTGLVNVEGRMRYNINIKGSYYDPDLYGYIKIVDGSFFIPGFVNAFRDLNAYLNFYKRRIDINYLEVENGNEKISGKGFLLFNDWSKPGSAVRLRTVKDNGLSVDLAIDMFRIRGNIKLDLTLQGENGKNSLNGKLILDENIIIITPFTFDVSRKKGRLKSSGQKTFLDNFGLNIDLIIGQGVDLRLNPGILEMRLVQGGKLNVKKSPGKNSDLIITGVMESRKGLLKAYNSNFNITYSKIEFKNEFISFKETGKSKRENRIYMTLNTRTIVKDEENQRIDIFLDFNGEINSSILRNFNKYLVMRIPSGRSKQEIYAMLGANGEGLSLLLSPFLNVFRDALGFIDTIEGKTKAFENISGKSSSGEFSERPDYRRLNPLHNTEFKIGKYINIFGLFSNNFYLKYSYIFKQDPIGKNVSGYHKIGLDWTLFNFESGNLILNLSYSPYAIEDKYEYEPKGMLITNILF